MSILSINSSYKTKTIDNSFAELRLKRSDRYIVNSKHVQFTPINVLMKRLNFDDYEKVIFVLRHASRPLNDWSSGVELTDLGKYSAYLAGKHLNGITSKFKYYSTNTVRTKQTAFQLYTGRNEVNQTDDIIRSYTDIPAIPSGISNLNFIKDQTKYDNYTDTDGYYKVWYNYIYGTHVPLPENLDNIDHQYMDAFNNITSVATDFITSAFNTTTEKFNIIISHDQNIMPLVAYSTNYIVNFKSYANPNEDPTKIVYSSWLNFLSGIIMLKKVGENDTYFIPITGLSTGYN